MKTCPLLKGLCIEERCAWWNKYECCIKTLISQRRKFK